MPVLVDTGIDCINYIGEESSFKLFLSLQFVLEDTVFKSIYGFFRSILSGYPTEMNEFDSSFQKG